MTQIAASIATMSLTKQPTGKAPGAPTGSGMNFAAVVAGLPAGDVAAPESEALMPDDAHAETGQELPDNDGGYQADGQPVVQDLALTAAAQSAMADMVVPPPAMLPVAQPPHQGSPATEAIALDVSARPSWRRSSVESISLAPVFATSAPLADAPAAMPSLGEGRAPSAAATPIPVKSSAMALADIVEAAPATQSLPGNVPTIDPVTKPTVPVAVPALPSHVVAPALAAQETPVISRAATSASAEAAAPVAHLLRRIAAETPRTDTAGAVTRRPSPAMVTPLANAALVAVADAPAAAVDAVAVASAGLAPTRASASPMVAAMPEAPRPDESRPATAVTGAVPLTLPEMPLASVTADMLRRRPDLTGRPAAPVSLVAMPAPTDVTPSLAPAVSDVPALIVVPEGEDVAPALQGDSAPAAASVMAKDLAVRPALASLPLVSTPPSSASPARSASGMAIAQVPAQPATDISTPVIVSDGGVEEAIAAAAPPVAPTVRPVMSALHRAAPNADPSIVAPAPSSARDAGTKQQDADATPDRASAGTAALAGEVAATAPRVYADIVQSLPPIAQNAIGAAGSTAAVTVAPDIGATLENRVIDMSVGGQWIDRVAQEITQLAQGTGHSRFQLSPPNLGRIQIDIRQAEGGGSHVQMLTETSEAAQRLREGQSSLQSDARVAALSLGTIAISHAASAFDMANDQGSSRQPSGDANAQAFSQGNQNGQGSHGGHQGNQPQQQPTQSGQAASGGQLSQNGGQNPSQQGQQATQDGNSNGQGKSSLRGDVLEGGAGKATQEGTPARGTGDRLVRYA